MCLQRTPSCSLGPVGIVVTEVGEIGVDDPATQFIVLDDFFVGVDKGLQPFVKASLQVFKV
jgi:hypothetical protein